MKENVRRGAPWLLGALILGSVLGCSSPPSAPPVVEMGYPASSPTSAPTSAELSGLKPIERPQSRWVPVAWADLPGLDQDSLDALLPSWLRSCERPSPVWAGLCPALRQLAQATPAAQQQWVRTHLQPYRVQSPQGQPEGLLTAYYEPLLEASRQPQAGFTVPLYAPPAGLTPRKPWFTRQDIETQPQAKAALRGKALAYLSDPVDAMVLHIQGSGLLRLREADGRVRTVRMAFAGTNEHAYKSIGRWLLDQGLVRDASWPGIKAWLERNPARTQELLWQNPRYVFFREEALPPQTAPERLHELPGPKGAQGVPLTAGRSIAVDAGSVPYGTPLWLVSRGPQTSLARWVMAQDTGSAIVGAVRADYFAGAGPQAGELAGRLKQPLQLWALWPK